MMTEAQVAALITDAIQGACDAFDGEPPFDGVEAEGIQTFAEAGLLTGNAGIVIPMADGTEFQVTIVQSA